jgi:protein-tyrosine kinase
MSRIFDALQRSDLDRGGAGSTQSALLATEVLQVTDDEAVEVHDRLDDFPVRRPVPPAEARVVCLTEPESLAAEKFRFLAVRLRQVQQARGIKKLLITSTIAEEGKSMVSANLAFSLARKKRQKVLLLEGDLRRPVLCTRLGFGRLNGLVEWAHGDTGRIPSIYRLEDTGVWFLPAGMPPEHPLELIQAPQTAALFEQLTSWFDWVIIDSPPVLPLADTSVWTRLAEGVLLVTREGTTDKRELKRGLEALDKSKLFGMVVNGCGNTDHSNYYQRYAPAVRGQQEGAENS